MSLTQMVTIMTQTAPDSLVANRYRILRKLGQSQSAKVYEAHDYQYERRAILKFPTAEAAYLGGLQQEIGALRSISHLNVVAFYDNGTDPTYGTFFVMEFASGDRKSTRLNSSH